MEEVSSQGLEKNVPSGFRNWVSSRLGHSFFGWFIPSFILWNWKTFAFLIFSEKSIEEKLWTYRDYALDTEIEGFYALTFWLCFSTIPPLLLAMVVPIVGDWLAAMFVMFRVNSEAAHNRSLVVSARHSQRVKALLKRAEIGYDIYGPETKKLRAKLLKCEEKLKEVSNERDNLNSQIKKIGETTLNREAEFKHLEKQYQQNASALCQEIEDAISSQLRDNITLKIMIDKIKKRYKV